MKEVPQFSQVIFNGGAGSDEFKTGLKRHGRLRSFGGRVFNGLGLVENDCLPFYLGEQLRFLLEQSIGSDKKIKFT